MKELSVLSIFIGHNRYAVEVHTVLDILDTDYYKPVPEGEVVHGTVETPEAVIPVIDLCVTLDISPFHEVRYKSIVIVRQHFSDTDFELGLMVDSVNGTYDIEMNAGGEITDITDDLGREVPISIFKILDTEKFLTPDEKNLAYRKFYRRSAPVEESETVPLRL